MASLRKILTPVSFSFVHVYRLFVVVIVFVNGCSPINIAAAVAFLKKKILAHTNGVQSYRKVHFTTKKIILLHKVLLHSLNTEYMQQMQVFEPK